MRSDCGGIQCDSLISLDSVSSLNCPVAAGFRPVAQTNTVISRSFSPQTGGYVSLPWFQWHAVSRPGHASSHYDEWWASIIPVWKQPLLLWLSLANEGCIIHPLAFFFFNTYFLSLLLSSSLSHIASPPLFLCSCALWVLSSGPRNTQTSCREALYGVFLHLWLNAPGAGLAQSLLQMGLRRQPQLYQPRKVAQPDETKATPSCVDIMQTSSAFLLCGKECAHGYPVLLSYVQSDGLRRHKPAAMHTSQTIHSISPNVLTPGLGPSIPSHCQCWYVW